MTTAHPELHELVAEVGGFYVRDRRLAREQKRMEQLIAADVTIDDATITRYRETVRAYFTGFNDEARRHVRTIDARLESLAQLQFNAVAERGVAARRLAVTTAVLEHEAKLAP